MRRYIIFSWLILLTACGAKGSKKETVKQNSEPVKACRIFIESGDSPALIARKAFRMKDECGIESEAELVRKIRKYDG